MYLSAMFYLMLQKKLATNPFLAYTVISEKDDPQRVEIPDLEHSDEEERYITIGLVHDILYVVYCDRDNPETGETDTRLISARKAKGWEIVLYNDNIQGRY